MDSIADLDWLNSASQIAAVFIGGALVMLANELAERRRQRSARDDEMQQERALYTGVFAVRNFIAEQIGLHDGEVAIPPDVSALEVAQRNLHNLIEKSRPTGESLMIALFEMSLRLDDVVSSVRNASHHNVIGTARLSGKVDALVAAIEQFDVISRSSLILLSDEDLGVSASRGKSTVSETKRTAE
jgi:hypothetical protein